MKAEAWPEVRRGPADVGVKGVGWMRRGGAEERGEEGAVTVVAWTAWAAAAAWAAALSPPPTWGKRSEGCSP